MDVQLYVYDLTRGMARAMSQQLLGIQIDAVYHTSLVFDNVEYFFGAGVQTCYPGATHHGRPMEIVKMGTSQLPMDTIMSYLDSMKEIYTPESYDLFSHNCNNFTNDFGMFLVGKGIPDHITSLPKRVLDTPFGQMLRPQIDASMRAVTQAEVPPAKQPASSTNKNQPSTTSRNDKGGSSRNINNGTSDAAPYGKVVIVKGLAALDTHMANASNTCATIFFTSSTCAPCKIVYPMFDNLADEYPQALFVKVDVGEANDVAMRYQIRAMPTFMTFSKGAKVDEWTGANPPLLKSNVERLVQKTFPPHPHLLLKVPTLQFGSMKPVTYVKVPPLDKLIAKLGAAASNPDLKSLRTFIERRNVDPREATLPNLQSVSETFQTEVLAVPVDVRFAAIDLLRCAMIDQRVSGYFAEEMHFVTLLTLVKHVNELQDCPHNLRLVTLHLACNMFTSALFVKELMQQDGILTPAVIQLVASSLLDASHPTTRVAAASLAFNLATANYRVRREEAREGLAEEGAVELAASLVETLSAEENSDATRAILLALGYLLYCARTDGEVMDLCHALDAKNTISSGKHQAALAQEVATLL